MHCRGAKYIESIKKKKTFHAGLGPKIHFGILTKCQNKYYNISQARHENWWNRFNNVWIFADQNCICSRFLLTMVWIFDDQIKSVILINRLSLHICLIYKHLDSTLLKASFIPFIICGSGCFNEVHNEPDGGNYTILWPLIWPFSVKLVKMCLKWPAMFWWTYFWLERRYTNKPHNVHWVDRHR